jgi:hypothetical protein
MNLITWLFFVLRKVIVVPLGSINDMEKTEEDAKQWYKDIDKDERLKPIKTKVFEFWAFKLALLVLSIWLIPALRRTMHGADESTDEMINTNDR